MFDQEGSEIAQIKAGRPVLRRHRIGSKVRAGFSALGAATLAVAMLAGTASAAVTTGRAFLQAPPVCDVGYGWRDLYATVPTVFAADRTVGTGNDLQLVRYWTRLYDYASGTPLDDWGFGGAGYANDNQAATLPTLAYRHGTPYQNSYQVTTPTPLVRMQYLIAWYTTSGVYIGQISPGIATYQEWTEWDMAHLPNTVAC